LGSKPSEEASAPTGRTLLLIENLGHTFPPSGRDRAGHRALENVSFTTGHNEFVSVVGPSGCGKSTLLTLVSGLARPTDGTIEIDGQHIVGIRKDVGFIFQRDALLPWRTVIQNVQLALRFRGVSRKESHERASEVLSRFGLSDKANRYPHQLSGGQRKRVSIAATLIYEPVLLLMDEPFSALDVQTRDLIEDDVLRVWQQSKGQTILFVTHDLEEAIALSDRVLVMSAGPGGTVIGDYKIELERPRELMEIRTTPHFREIYSTLWEHLRVEVRKTMSADAAGYSAEGARDLERQA
jgi:NitT/TauT family transport system ATP-binding protein